MPRLEGAYSTVVMTKRRDRRLPRPARRPAAVARPARATTLRRRLRELRLRHHRRQAAARGQPRRDGLAHRRRASRCARSFPSTRTAHCVFEHIYFSRPDSRLEGRVLQQVRGRMGEILCARGAGRRRPGDLGPRLRQPGGHRLRARLGHAQGRRPDQEPLRRADLHPARPGAAQARPADEVQPAAGDRRRQARRRRRRLDRARQHDPADRRHAARRRRRARSTCGSRRHRSAIPCHYGVDMSHPRGDGRPRAAPSTRSPTEVGADSLAYLSLEGVYEAVGTPARTTATPASPASYPLGEAEDGRQVRARGARRHPGELRWPERAGSGGGGRTPPDRRC